MLPETFQLYFSAHQDLLYLITLILDLGFTVIMYRFFGRYGLLACIVLSILLANLQGPKPADGAVMMGFSVSVIILIMLSISLLFLPSTQNEQTFPTEVHDAFVRILDFTPRFIFGSLLAYLISQRFDVWCFHKIKAWTNGKHLWLRNNLSTMASQTIDTTIYSFVVWWGIVDLVTAMQLGLAKMVFKIAIAAFDTPFIYWARNWSIKDSDK